MLGPVQWSMLKITKLDAKLSETWTKRVAPFVPGNVIYDFWAQKFCKVVYGRV